MEGGLSLKEMLSLRFCALSEAKGMVIINYAKKGIKKNVPMLPGW